MFDFLKKPSKTRDRFEATLDLQNNEERVAIQPGNIFRYLGTIKFLWKLSAELPIP